MTCWCYDFLYFYKWKYSIDSFICCFLNLTVCSRNYVVSSLWKITCKYTVSCIAIFDLKNEFFTTEVYHIHYYTINDWWEKNRELFLEKQSHISPSLSTILVKTILLVWVQKSTMILCIMYDNENSVFSETMEIHKLCI